MTVSPNSIETNNELRLSDNWSEITRTARIGECYTVKLASAERKPKKIDVTNMSAGGLESIREGDPFMYYSIPGVRSAELLMRVIDTSNLEGSTLGLGRETARDGSLHTVTRKRCISF